MCAIRTHLGLLICSFHCRAGTRANTCLWIPLHLDLIFTCLNLFKSFQLQSAAEIGRCNLIESKVEIEDAMLSLHRCTPTTQPSGKGRSFVVIYLAVCLSHLGCPGVWELALTKLGIYRLIWRGCTLAVQTELSNSNKRV